MIKASGKDAVVQPVIMIIDDDHLLQRSLARIMEAHGYVTVSYDSLPKFEPATKIPRLGCVLLDLNLPDTNGLEIQAWLAKISPSLSVIFLTGFGTISSSVDAMKPAPSIISKNPSSNQLCSRLLSVRSRAAGNSTTKATNCSNSSSNWIA